MGDRYKELRSAICATKAEKKRFRQVGLGSSFGIPINFLMLTRPSPCFVRSPSLLKLIVNGKWRWIERDRASNANLSLMKPLPCFCTPQL